MKWKTALGNALQRAGTRLKGSGDTFYSLQDPRLAKVLGGRLNLGNPKWINVSSLTDYADAWSKCPPMVAIITRKAQADLNGKVTFTRVKDDSLVNTSTQLQARAVEQLLSKPNPLQTWRQFRAQQKVYTQLFGFCPVLALRPIGMNDPSSIQALWNIPPHLVTLHTTGKLFFQTERASIIERIEVKYNGRSTDLDPKDVMILRDNVVSLNTEVVPDSRLSCLQYPISNIAAAYEASNVLITKRGALGILSNGGRDDFGAAPVTPQEKAEIQSQWMQYGVSEDLSQVIITSAALRWQQIALPVRDLMLFETIADSTRQIADVYGYDYNLLASEKGSTYNNVNEAKKSLYQDTIIPEADADMEVYAGFFGLTQIGIRISLSFDHVEVLQESEEQKAKALQIMATATGQMFRQGSITLNRMRELQGEKPVQGDDLYYSQWLAKNAPTAIPVNQNESRAIDTADSQ